MKFSIEFFDSQLKQITEKITLLAGWVLLTLSIVVTVNILSRKFINFSLQGVDEYGGYCLAVCAAIGFSQAAYDRAHIRISVITDLLPVRIRAFFDVLSLLILTSVAFLLASKAFGVAETSYSMRALAVSSLRTPLVVPQGIWAGALSWFCLILTVQFLRAIFKLARSDWVGVVRDYGVPSLDEEVGQELKSARERIGSFGKGS